MNSVFNHLAGAIRQARLERGLSQADLASRIGRDRARVSELERDLRSGRLGRDRLTLFAEICDTLDLVPLLVPQSRAAEVAALIEGGPDESPARRAPPAAFDDLFIDLDDGQEG